MQAESGVLNLLDQTPTYSYSVFPGSSVKKDVVLKFYQKPVAQYKLTCETTEGRSLKHVLSNSLELKLPQGTSNMFDNWSRMAVASLCVLLPTPFVSAHGTVLCTPLAMIVVAGVFASMIAT